MTEHIKFYMASMANYTVSPTLPRRDFTATRGTILNWLSITVNIICENAFLLRELLTCGTVCHHMFNK